MITRINTGYRYGGLHYILYRVYDTIQSNRIEGVSLLGREHAAATNRKKDCRVQTELQTELQTADCTILMHRSSFGKQIQLFAVDVDASVPPLECAKCHCC